MQCVCFMFATSETSTASRLSTIPGLYSARVNDVLCLGLLCVYRYLAWFSGRNCLKGTSIIHRARRLCETCFWLTSLSRLLRLKGLSDTLPPCHNSIAERNFSAGNNVGM